MSKINRWVWSGVEATTHGAITELRHLDGGARLSVRNGRLVRGEGYATAKRGVRQQLARVGAILRLRERERYFLHASGAVDPSGKAWLLTGDSGSGKSTLAFALSRAGWRILGDDGIVLELQPLGAIAHPWREPLRVSLSLAPRYSMLERITEKPELLDERRRVPVPVVAARSAPVAGILLLKQSRVHSMTRVDPAEALSQVVRQSPWVLLGDASTAAHYYALLTLVHTVPVYDLAHSPAELDTLAHTLQRAA